MTFLAEAGPPAIPLPLDRMAPLLGYTLQDLALNRTGVLSPEQAANSVRAAVPMVVFALAALGIVAIIAFVVKPTGFGRVVLTIMSLAGAALGLALAWSTVAAAVERRVLVAEGPLEFTSGYRQSVNVIVGTFRGPVHNARAAFVPGVRYRVYYLARSGDFLSAEPVAAGGG